MLIIVIALQFLEIALVFITFAIVILLFAVNITLFTVNIIKKHNGTLRRRIIPIVLPGVGIIVSVLLLLPYLKLYYKITQEQTKVQRGIIDFDQLKHKAGVNTVVFWAEDVLEDETRKYFIYGGRKYIKFDAFGLRDANFEIAGIRDVETDKAAGIILDEKQEKDAFFNGLFNVLFKGQAGQRVSYKYLYAVKGRGDRSLLIVKHNFSYDEELFCAEEEFSDSRNYYNDIDNYGLVVSKSGGNAYIFDDFYYIDGKETVSRPLSKDSFGILTGNGEKDNYRGNGILIPNSFTPKGRGYTYINIYGISGDGVYKKLLRHYIVDNDDIYYADAYNIVDISVVKLYADEKAFLLSLLE